jgi:riboflavin biosynthesis pyrimidine reductase
VSSLIKSSLVDEFHLIVNPSALGSGLAIFNKISSALNLFLINATLYPSGIVLSQYKSKK